MTPINNNQMSELREKLADIEHQRWADWQKWCHKVLREQCPSEALEKVLARWDKQIATLYKDLTEKEKNSDREQVDRYLPLILTLISHERAEAVSIILNLPRIRKGYYNEETGESEDTIRVKILEEYLSNESK